MTLHQHITDKIAAVSKAELVQTLGYGNAAKGLETLNAFLQAKDTDEWLHSSHYDFKYNSQTFLTALGKALDISDEEIERAIAEQNERQKRLDAMTLPFIFINTRFRRKNEPIFALALLENRRRLILDKEQLLDMDDDAVFALVSEMVKAHYKEVDGALPLWGKIHNYIYHHTDDRQFVFDTDGNLKEDVTPAPESKAELRIGNKPITL